MFILHIRANQALTFYTKLHAVVCRTAE